MLSVRASKIPPNGATEDEQSELAQRIRHLKKIVAEEQKHEMDAEGFLRLVRKYTDIKELTPEILHEFIDKIVVHHREMQFGKTVQKVEIYYEMIGKIELPRMNPTEKKSYLQAFRYK